MANLPTWNLKDFYPDFKSKKINKDLKFLKDKAVAFNSKYKGKLRNLSVRDIEKSIKEFEKIEEKVQFIHSFAFLTYCTDQTNEEKSKFFQDIEEKINKIQIDTHHFKGNYPDQCSIQAAYINGKSSANKIINKSKGWKLLLNKSKLHAHKKHNFSNKLMKKNKVNYLRINIFPDGGISRIRVFGKTQ